MKMVALIPARSGSKRIPGKNTNAFAGAPLIAHTLASAIESGVFSKVIVSTDDQTKPRISIMAYQYGADHAHIRDRGYGDDDPDIIWVTDCLKWLKEDLGEAFAILRPTSPFRSAAMIRRAYEKFMRTPDVHSLRAVQPVTEHPGKMWIWSGPGYPITPIWNPVKAGDTPYHSRPTQSLPQVFVQNASLEMAWTYCVTQMGTISGTKVLPFFTEGYEGFDLNTPDDWARAEQIAAEHPELLPRLHEPREA